MKSMILIIIASALVNNVVLNQFLGICSFLGVSKQMKPSASLGVAVIFVMTIASAVASLLYDYVLQPFGLDYMKTIVFILVIAALVQLVEIILKKYIKPLYKALGIYLPLITTNCAVLAVTILNIDESYNFIESCVDGATAGIGFGLALILFCGVRKALERAKPPKCFEGLPITLVAAALTSMTFMGFAGIADNLFH